MDTYNMNQMPPIPTEAPKKSLAPMIAVVVLLAIIIIGGLYFLQNRTGQTPYIPTLEDSVTKSIQAQGQLDDLDSIEADLNAETFDNIDQGAAVIEAELE